MAKRKITKAAITAFFDNVRRDRSVQIRKELTANPKLLDLRGDKGIIRGNTPLLYSLRCESFRSARVLIELGANVNAKLTVGNKWTCLNWSVGTWMDLEILELLLENGAEPNRCGADHDFPLKRAIELAVSWKGLYTTQGKKAIDLLTEYGADMDFKSKPKSAKSAREQIHFLIENEPARVPIWMKNML